MYRVIVRVFQIEGLKSSYLFDEILKVEIRENKKKIINAFIKGINNSHLIDSKQELN
jgi:hypothetical protein